MAHPKEHIEQIATLNIPASISSNKAKYQIFTPRDIVCLMLNLIGYDHNVVGKRILENSFGEGVFILEIAERYIKYCLEINMEPRTIAKCLKRDIVGYEIDLNLIDRTRDSLDKLARTYGINDVNWDLRHADALFAEYEDGFHFIVGNPPYLSYRDIPEDYRGRLHEKFESCKNGKFDYCYAFIESALSHLGKDGVLAQLVPNSIFKNVFGERIRSMLKKGIASIVDYSGANIFDGALVSPCIFTFENDSNTPMVSVRKWNQEATSLFAKDDFSDKWIFAKRRSKINKMRFGDMFHASMPVATLCNKAFLVDKTTSIEKELIHPAASPRTAKEGLKQGIIFPYRINRTKSIERYTLEQFTSRFPNGTAYLKEHEESLGMRKSDPAAQWFEYGRSQGLRLVPLQKLLMSTVVTNKIATYNLEKNVVPYSGIVITAKEPNASLEDAKSILESDDFLEYALSVGTSIGGSSVRITCKDVNEYYYPISKR